MILFSEYQSCYFHVLRDYLRKLSMISVSGAIEKFSSNVGCIMEIRALMLSSEAETDKSGDNFENLTALVSN